MNRSVRLLVGLIVSQLVGRLVGQSIGLSKFLKRVGSWTYSSYESTIDERYYVRQYSLLNNDDFSQQYSSLQALRKMG